MNKIKRNIFIVLVALISICDAGHSSVIHEYTGNNYQSIFDFDPLDSTRYTNAMKLTGFFTLDSPLRASHSINTEIIPLAFSFTDGIHTLTQLNTDSRKIYVETDSSGAITDWKINLSTGYPDPVSTGDTQVLIATWSVIDSGRITKCLTPSSIISNFCNGITLDEGKIENAPGTWMVSSVPIPTAVWLFSSGILGLIGIARREKF